MDRSPPVRDWRQVTDLPSALRSTDTVVLHNRKDRK